MRTGTSKGVKIMRPIILASSSPRRKELLQGLKLQFAAHPSDADESVPAGTEPEAAVELLSLRKALSVAAHYDDGVVIGSDTIVVCDNEILGKPIDENDAFRMLSLLQGRSHFVYTGVAIVAAEAGKSHVEPLDQTGGHDTAAMLLGDIGRYRVISKLPGEEPESMVGYTASKVTFRPMSDAEIDAYIKTGEPLDKAGAYGIQGIGAVFIEKIEGDFYSVMGLPLNLLYQMLLRFGVNPFMTEVDHVL
jgi:septum formation protein